MNVEMYQRNDRILRVTIEDENGDPLNLMEASITFEVRNLFTKTIGDGITVTDEEGGTIEIEITQQDTDQRSGRYRLELLVTDVNGHRYTAAQGTFTLLFSDIE